MKDVFTYDNNIAVDGQIASADFANISVGKDGAQNSLVQSLRVAYRHQIEEVTEVGSPTIRWIPGKPQGNISISELVGPDGFFKRWQAECGRIRTAAIKVDGGHCGFEGAGRLFFQGAVVEALSMDMSTGRQTITQGAEIRVTSMSA